MSCGNLSEDRQRRVPRQRVVSPQLSDHCSLVGRLRFVVDGFDRENHCADVVGVADVVAGVAAAVAATYLRTGQMCKRGLVDRLSVLVTLIDVVAACASSGTDSNVAFG